jgi:hypothetical protein
MGYGMNPQTTTWLFFNTDCVDFWCSVGNFAARSKTADVIIRPILDLMHASLCLFDTSYFLFSVGNTQEL